MGDRREELDASIDLNITFALQHCGDDLKPDVEYAHEVMRAAPALVEAAKAARELLIAVAGAGNVQPMLSRWYIVNDLLRDAIRDAEGYRCARCGHTRSQHAYTDPTPVCWVEGCECLTFSTPEVKVKL